MATTTAAGSTLESLYKVRKGRVEFVDVPECGFAVVDGTGTPGGAAFTGALQALYSVSFGAHFALKKATGAAPRVMALEALWWIDGLDDVTFAQRLLAGAGAATTDRDEWRWRMMIAQLPPIDEAAVYAAAADAKTRKATTALDDLRFVSWREGPSAQILHIGPYAAEAESIATLHEAIAGHGSRPRGAHHEIYLGDPRRAAPEKLRTILRQPIEPLA